MAKAPKLKESKIKMAILEFFAAISYQLPLAPVVT
jgi:hypothetical protein